MAMLNNQMVNRSVRKHLETAMIILNRKWGGHCWRMMILVIRICLDDPRISYRSIVFILLSESSDKPPVLCQSAMSFFKSNKTMHGCWKKLDVAGKSMVSVELLTILLIEIIKIEGVQSGEIHRSKKTIGRPTRKPRSFKGQETWRIYVILQWNMVNIWLIYG